MGCFFNSLLNELVADDVEALGGIILRLEQDEAYNVRCVEAGLTSIATRLAEPAIDRLLKNAIG